MMWTALAMRLFAVITITISVTFKLSSSNVASRSPRSLPAQAVFYPKDQLSGGHPPFHSREAREQDRPPNGFYALQLGEGEPVHQKPKSSCPSKGPRTHSE